jgi:hypothetical protein
MEGGAWARWALARLGSLQVCMCVWVAQGPLLTRDVADLVDRVARLAQAGGQVRHQRLELGHLTYAHTHRRAQVVRMRVRGDIMGVYVCVCVCETLEVLTGHGLAWEPKTDLVCEGVAALAKVALGILLWDGDVKQPGRMHQWAVDAFSTAHLADRLTD